MKKLKNINFGYILLGVLVAAIGVFFVSFNNSIEVLAIIMGIILALVGIIFGVLTLVKKDRGVRFALKIALSIIFIVCGSVTALVRGGVVEIIASIFCLLLIVDGSFKLQTAILSKRYSLFGWWLMLSLSVLIISSAFLITRLVSDSAILTVLIGIVMIIDGGTNIFSSIYTSLLNSKIKEAAVSELADTHEG